MKGLTKRQQEVLSFIEDYIEKNHFSPSYREIMKQFGFSSPSSAAKHIHVLIRKGALSHEKNCGRSIRTLQLSSSEKRNISEVELPYIGYISLENFIETFPQTQTLTVPSYLVYTPEDTYILRSRGNSLQEEHISDGDLLIVEARREAFDGETVIASASREPALVKKYHPEGQYARLASQSVKSPALIVPQAELSIHGILVSLLRLYSYTQFS